MRGLCIPPGASLAQATFLSLGEFWKSTGLKAAAVEELRVGKGGKGEVALAVLWTMWLGEMRLVHGNQLSKQVVSGAATSFLQAIVPQWEPPDPAWLP